MKKIIYLSLSLLTATVVFTSCKKDTVVNQSVNNAVSEIITINPNQWVAGNVGGEVQYKVSYNIIDSDLPLNDFVLGKDIVLLYASTGTANSDPEYALMGNGTLIGNYYYFYEVSAASNGAGVVTITAAPASNSVTTAPNSTLYIHAVYIQPTDLNSNPTSNVNTKDYNAVKRAYNLK